ncbi:MAG: polysaccharide pyruvyl transferase family protein, partial [Pseudomonadota bacterium]
DPSATPLSPFYSQPDTFSPSKGTIWSASSTVRRLPPQVRLMNILLAPDTSDHHNWGCRVMGEWYREKLDSNKEGGTLQAVGSKWFFQANPELPELKSMDDFRRYADEVKAGRVLKGVAKVLQGRDVIFLNGENFIRPHTLKGRMLLFIAYLAKAIYDKPCILSNHTVELTDDPALAEIVSEVYPLLDQVHFREQTSWDIAAHLVAEERRKMIPDVAWAVPAAPRTAWIDLAMRRGHFSAWPDSAENFNPARPYVTLCASSIYSMPKYQNLDVVPVFWQLVKRLSEEVAPVLLTAPCIPEMKIMRQIHAKTRVPLLGSSLPVRQAIDLLGNAAVHVGGRWHLAIFAATGGTPLVAMGANNHKMHSLIRQLNLEEPIFDALALEQHVDAIVSRARQHVDSGQDLRQRILQRSRELGGQVESQWSGGIRSFF